MNYLVKQETFTMALRFQICHGYEIMEYKNALCFSSYGDPVKLKLHNSSKNMCNRRNHLSTSYYTYLTEQEAYELQYGTCTQYNPVYCPRDLNAYSEELDYDGDQGYSYDIKTKTYIRSDFITVSYYVTKYTCIEI